MVKKCCVLNFRHGKGKNKNIRKFHLRSHNSRYLNKLIEYNLQGCHKSEKLFFVREMSH